MDNKRRNKRKNILLVILLGACCANMVRTHLLDNARTVDIVQLFAGGLVLGLLIASLIKASKDRAARSQGDNK